MTRTVGYTNQRKLIAIRLGILLITVSLVGLGCSREDSDVQPVDLDELEDLSYVASGITHHDSTGKATVKLASAWADEHRLIVRAVFTPDDAGFHFYSSNLPRAGIRGIGRPTLLEASDPDKFSKIGYLVADKTPKERSFPILDATFPVYPDGPVTLYLPLVLRSDSPPYSSISFKLTYMTCSDQICNRPVEDVLVTLDIPPKDRI